MKKILVVLSLLLITACSQKQPVEVSTGFNEPTFTAKEAEHIKSSADKLEKEIKKIKYSNQKSNLQKTPVQHKTEPNTFKQELEKLKEQKQQVFNSINKNIAKIEDSYKQQQNLIKENLKQRLAEQKKISDLIKNINKQQQTPQQVTALKPETAVLDPVEELEPLFKEPTWQEKIYNATLKPVKLQILKWNAFVNKQVSHYMKQLKNNPSLWIVLVSVFAAFVYGILHTLGPGHGKMVVATYFLTNNAKIWQGIMVGLQTAFAHVAGAVILIFITDISLRNFILNPEQHMYLLKNISFGLIIFIGLIMFTQAILHALGKKQTGCAKCNAHHHNHEHNHSHDHGHNHSHSHKINKKESLIALTIGCVPCTGSLLILLYAMANDMLVYGLVMVLFVALGMALTMIVIGILAILGKKHLIDDTLSSSKHSHKYALGIEFLGAVFIITIGLILLSANL